MRYVLFFLVIGALYTGASVAGKSPATWVSESGVLDVAGQAANEAQTRLGDGEAKTSGCERPEVGIVKLSRSKYPNIVSHIKESWREGYAKVRRINRIGTSTRRDKLLQGIPTKPGFDRDEAPAAVLRTQVRASVRYVPSSENRSAGSTLGHQLGRYCDGVRVRYVFTP